MNDEIREFLKALMELSEEEQKRIFAYVQGVQAALLIHEAK